MHDGDHGPAVYVIAILAVHVLAAAGAPGLVRLFGRRAFVMLAAVPGGSFIWFAMRGSAVAGVAGAPATESWTWVPGMHLDIDLRLTTLTWVLALVVSGIGALVLAYCASYMRADDPALERFALVFVGFAGSMLGLVLADNLLLLYVFWEATTVLSYLLIGHNPDRIANRRAAMTALIVTTFGGLAMLVGIVLLGEHGGTYRVSELVARSAGAGAGASASALTIVAVILLLVGAISKSALVPFHFWLPRAMAAPTPVSAYLHAAAMVKAGVFLVALLAPAYAAVPGWRPVLLVLGVTTMLHGAVVALRQTDLKLLLGYGTVSQLGFLAVALGLGSRAAALAGLAMLCAHAMFKAALFMAVGVVDRVAGTRDLAQLSGVRRQLRLLFWVAVVAAASMAGLPPLFGFVAKEAVFGAVIGAGHDGPLGTVTAWVVVAGIVTGSALTVAYTARLLWGLFGDKPGVAPTPLVDRAAYGVPFVLPALVLAGLSVVFGLVAVPVSHVLDGYARELPGAAHDGELALWHGLSPALACGLAAIVGGVLLHVWHDRLPLREGPRWWDADRAYRGLMHQLERAAVEVTARSQAGSLPVYVATVLLVVVALPGWALVRNRDWAAIDFYGGSAQLAAGLLAVTASVLAVRARRRLSGAILAGVCGYSVAGLFFLHGAPDLALTQVLVETVTLVVFVLVLRRLPVPGRRHATAARWVRAAIGALVGGIAVAYGLAAVGARSGPPISEHFADAALEYGGGRNIVNVTLVDIRAWDTMGELSVLVVAATGVASLVFLFVGRRATDRPDAAIKEAGSGRWLRAARTLSDKRQSVILAIVTRLVFHSLVVVSVYLVFSGHNGPGGGFAAGLVTGIALTLRYLAGGRHELDEAAPIDAGLVLGLGLTIATLTGLAPLVFGGEVLQSALIDISLPGFGDVHIVTSLFFDAGVYLVVVGVVLDILRSLGGGVDRQLAQDAVGTQAGEPAALSGGGAL